MSRDPYPRWSRPIVFGSGILLGVSLTCARPGADPGGSHSPAAVLGGGMLAVAPAFARTPSGGTLADIAQRAVPGVVNLSVSRRVPESGGRGAGADDRLLHEFFGPDGPWDVPRDRQQRSLGSGVVVTSDGVVLTSAHVVDGARQVDITLSDGRELDGVVVGSDPRSDLAVVRIQDAPRDLVALPFGDSSRARLGDVVLAIGNPFGVGQTVTMGIVSATGRSRVGIVDYEDFIQTDAAINPGNSGGALLDMSGELVGINTAILSRSGGYQGIGFAIPSAMAEPIMRSLVDRGVVVRGWLGMSIQEIDRDLAQALRLRVHDGIVVSDVTGDGPAARAGVARGDIIRSLDGVPVVSAAAFRNHIAGLAPDTRVVLGVEHAGQRRVVAVRLGQLAGDPRAPRGAGAGAGRVEVPAPGAGLLSGLRVIDLTATPRRQLRVPARVHGVVVSAVAPDSAAERAGVATGDVVLEINGKAVRSTGEFRARAARVGDAVALLVLRGGSSLYLATRR